MRTLPFSFIALIVFSLFASCKKEYDLPPVKNSAQVPSITIAAIKAKFGGVDKTYQFLSDSSLYCTITADEVSGNIYKTIFVQDSTGAICLKLTSGSSGRLFAGDNIRVNLKNAVLGDYHSLIQLDSVDVDNNIVKQSSGSNPQPILMTIEQIMANTAATNSVQSRLVRINNVEFIPNSLTPIFAPPQSSGYSQTITACNNTKLEVRTSGYSNFASKTIPNGNGYIIAIASQYNSGMQLSIRNYSDLNMNGTLCNGGTSTTTPSGNTYLTKNFEDSNLQSGGWTQVTVLNTAVAWTASSFSSDKFAKVSGYVSNANSDSEAWLISPVVDLSTSTNPALSFRTAARFPGNALEVYVSTNYSSGNPTTATWTALSGYNLSPNTTNYVWTQSGAVSLSAYKTANLRIAFKYTSTIVGATTYEVDDITVKEHYF